MRKKTRSRIAKVIFLIFLFSVFVYQHESIHQTIYRAFGINSTIGMFDITTAATFPNETQVADLRNESMNEFYSLEYLQIEAEIIGYNAFPIYIILALVLLSFI